MPIINGNVIYEFGGILLFMPYLHYNNMYTTSIWKYKIWKMISILIALDKGLIYKCLINKRIRNITYVNTSIHIHVI